MAAWVGRRSDWLPKQKRKKRRVEKEPPPENLPSVEFLRTACPGCGSTRTIVRSTRQASDGIRWRYHKCDQCEARFASWEKVDV